MSMQTKTTIILVSVAVVFVVALFVGFMLFPFTEPECNRSNESEYYCVFAEYDCSRSNKQAHEQLLANGYVMYPGDAPEEEFSGETLYWLASPNGDDALAVIECDSVEIAKQVYADFFKPTEEQSAHVVLETVFLGATSICRINSCVYALRGGDTFSEVLFLAYDLEIPRATYVHDCQKVVKAKDLSFDVITRIASACGYTCYYNSSPAAFFKQQVFIVSPKRDTAFTLVQTSDKMDRESRDVLKTLYFDSNIEILKGNKLVLLPDDTAIVGNCGRLDEFLELLRNKIGDD